MTKEQMRSTAEMRNLGVSYSAIAKKLNVSRETVKSYCRRHGITPVDSIDSDIGVCRQCGKAIVQQPKRKRREFCSDVCRTVWWSKNADRVKRKAIYNFDCSFCGKQFTVYGNSHRKYCSHECYIADRFRRTQHERNAI